MGHFTGRVAIVTGSGQGIGRDLALYLASEGCKMVTNNRKPGSSMQAHDGKTVKLAPEDEAVIGKLVGDAETTAAQIIAAGGEAIPVYGNSAIEEDCKRMVDAAIGQWGRIDIIVNNAASHWDGCIKDMDPKIWDITIASKLSGTFYLMHYALPHMVEQGYGRFVNVSSNAFIGLKGLAAYSAAACGIWAFTKATAQDLEGTGILVNAITPLAATRSWYNTLAEYRAKGIPLEYIESAAPDGMKQSPENMVPAIAYMASDRFDISGAMVKVEANGDLALYTDPEEYNQCGHDLIDRGPYTFDELEDIFSNELFVGFTKQGTSLSVN